MLARLSVLFLALLGFFALPQWEPSTAFTSYCSSPGNRALCKFLITSAAEAGFHGGGSGFSNANSPLGINFSQAFTPYGSENAPLNLFKMGGGWYTLNGGSVTAEGVYLYSNCLDANGYPITLTTTVGSCASTGHTFNAVSTQVMTNQTFYAGTWVLLWDNTGTFTVSKDGGSQQSCAVTGHPNRIIFTSSAAGSGISVTMNTTGSGASYAQNIRLVYSPDSTCGAIGTREALLYSNANALAPGGLDPNFIAVYQPFRVCRFMQWMATLNASTPTAWANRSPINWVFWDEGNAETSGVLYRGAPWELMIYAANALNCNPWFTFPVGADDTYVTGSANLVLADLNANLKPRTEYGNEIWNSSSVPYTQNINLAITTFGGGGVLGQYSMQAAAQAHIGYIWKGILGSSRVINVIGVQTVTDTGFASGECCGLTKLLFETPMWTGTGTALIYTGTIDNCSPSCGSGSAGVALKVTAVTSGTVAVGSPIIQTPSGSYLGTISALGASGCTPAGSGGTGCYTVSTSQLIASDQFLGGGGPSPGGLAYQYFDRIAIAPYFGEDPPPSWVSSADGGLTQLFTELESGGLQPTGSPVCTTGGTNIAYTVSSNISSCGSAGSVTCPPADQTILPVNFNQGSGANPTLAVDGCGTAYQIQNPPGTNTTVGAGVINVSFMASQNAWVLAVLGHTGGGLAYENTVVTTWTNYAASGLPVAFAVECYESGQTYASDATTASLIANAQTDARMGTAYTNYYGNIKTAGVHYCNHYEGIDQTPYWGMLMTVVQSTSAKYTAMVNFINANACWWANCQNGSWLFKRDLDPASNDNSPAFLDKAV